VKEELEIKEADLEVREKMQKVNAMEGLSGLYAKPTPVPTSLHTNSPLTAAQNAKNRATDRAFKTRIEHEEPALFAAMLATKKKLQLEVLERKLAVQKREREREAMHTEAPAVIQKELALTKETQVLEKELKMKKLRAKLAALKAKVVHREAAQVAAVAAVLTPAQIEAAEAAHKAGVQHMADVLHGDDIWSSTRAIRARTPSPTPDPLLLVPFEKQDTTSQSELADEERIGDSLTQSMLGAGGKSMPVTDGYKR
jgi:hypothetical protein